MIKHLYIHIPFCKRICPYCDFTKRVSSEKMMDEYKKKLIEEIEYYNTQLFDCETIFIGGGTPSYYPFLDDILSSLMKYIDRSKIKEFTVECTPETVLNILPFIKKYGINRVSIGVETLNEKTLKYLNRLNTTKDELKEIIKRLRGEGIKSINLDFIYSLPFETIESIKEEIELIKELNPDHISYYDLILEENTILSYDINHGKISLPSEDESALMRDYIEDTLEKAGYHQYEISNFSKTGFESLHNMSYWKLEDYLGIGLNSHSLVSKKRFSNTSDMKKYLSSDIKELREYYEFDEMEEYFLMGLRMNEGVSVKQFINKYGIDPIEKYNLKKHIDSSLLEFDGDILKFTKDGRHIGNIVFEEFV